MMVIDLNVDGIVVDNVEVFLCDYVDMILGMELMLVDFVDGWVWLVVNVVWLFFFEDGSDFD